jgi:formyl-CoA transferase
MLRGLRVLDFSRVLAAPSATCYLADLGATVWKVEHPRGGDETREWGPPFLEGKHGAHTRQTTYFLSINRGKQSVALDLKAAEGREAAVRLAVKADVVVENLLPGTMERLGLDYATLSSLNPHLVYCSLTGYGHTGPDRTRPGYDVAIAASTGLMDCTGFPSSPVGVKPGVAVTDLMTGAQAQSAILAALWARERDPERRGRFIDISLFDTGLAMMANVASAALHTDATPKRQGNAHASIAPYNVFTGVDGRGVVIAAMNDAQFARLCHALGPPVLSYPSDPRFATNPARVAHREALETGIHAAIHARSWTAADVELHCREAQVTAALVRTVNEALHCAQSVARHNVHSLPHPAAGTTQLAVAPPPRFSLPASPHPDPDAAAPRGPAPLLGEHTRQVLRDHLALTDAQIDAAHAAGWLFCAPPP